MAPLTPDQLRWRERIEGVIRLASPALNLVLAVGERISKIAEPEDHEYYPPRQGGDPGRDGQPGRGRAEPPPPPG